MRRRLLPIYVLLALAALPAQGALAQSTNSPPTACFTVSPSAPKTGETVTFSSSCSTDPDGAATITSRTWDLDNDGQYDDGSTASVTRTFATAGTYTIKLRVADNRTGVDTETKTVTVANRPPTASFTFTPASPSVNQQITFTATATDPEGGALTYRWSLDHDGVFNDGTSRTVTRAYTSPGTRNVKVEVTDANGGKTTVTKAVAVANRTPSACVTQAPSSPASGATVTFDSSCSADPDGSIATRAWDLDNDGQYDDGSGVTAARAWATPGTYTVRLRVTDAFSGTDTVSRVVTVGNRGPTAAFTSSPVRPVVGDTVTLRSTASDADGTIAAQAWDLDGDGQYDDATGASASFKPAAARTYTVGLRVVDDKAAFSVSERTIAVSSPPVPRPITPSSGVGPPAPPAQPTLRLLSPFPVVRMRGRTTRRGAKLTLFSVRGPHGAIAYVRCRGRGCPAKRIKRRLATKSERGTRTVRIKRLERLLRAGVRLRVIVTKQGMVGKYTSIRFRKLKLPVRTDRCVLPGSTKPTACPGGS